MNLLLRRRFAAYVGLAVAGAGSGVGCQMALAETKPSTAKPTLKPAPPNPEQLLFSLRSLIEVCCREAIEDYKDRLPLTLAGHVRKAWENWIRQDSTSANTPFLRFEVFDAFSRHVVTLLWEETLHHFMQKAHVLTQTDVRLVLVSVGTGHAIGTPWATTILERKARDNIHSRLLTLVLELELHWLVTQTDRYLDRPPARHGQLDTPEQEVALSVTRALLSTLVEEVATRERHWRQQPTPADPPLALQPILFEITKFYRTPSSDAPGAPPPEKEKGTGKLAITR